MINLYKNVDTTNLDNHETFILQLTFSSVKTVLHCEKKRSKDSSMKSSMSYRNVSWRMSSMMCLSFLVEELHSVGDTTTSSNALQE